MSLSGSSGSGTAPKRSYHRAACRRATDAYRAVRADRRRERRRFGFPFARASRGARILS